MSDVDDFELRRRLRAAAGAEPDLVAANTMLTARVARARQRRAAYVSTASVAVTLLLIGGLALRVRSDSTIHISPTAPVAAEPDTTSDTTGEATSTSDTAAPSSTIESTTSFDDPESSGPSIGAAAGGAAASTVPDVPQTDSSANTSATSAPQSSAGAPQGSATKTFASIGGSITIRLQDATMTLIAKDPTSGFKAEVEREKPDRIVVTFKSSDGEAKIEVRLIDGVMVQQVEDEESSSGDNESAGSHTTSITTTSITTTTGPDHDD